MDDHASFRELATYLILARVSELRARPYARDRLYLLAAALATRSLWPKTAACCRERILQHNPQHAVGRIATMEQALRSEEFQTTLHKAQQHYSREQAEFLLTKLQVELRKEQAKFVDCREFLATLLQVSPSVLDDSLA